MIDAAWDAYWADFRGWLHHPDEMNAYEGFLRQAFRAGYTAGKEADRDQT